MADGSLSRDIGATRPSGPAASISRVGRLLSRRGARWLVPVIYLGCLFAFLADIWANNTLAWGMFYIPLVCTAVFHKNPRAVWWLAGIASLLSIVGAYFPSIDQDLIDLVGNRLLSIVAILTTAAFVSYGRKVQEQLAEQTRRAEAAERIKTEIFTNLSQEIRTPLYSMVGLSGLMMANCRPDQRQPLGQVQGAGKRLLATIENLIDLTQIDNRTFRSERVDLNQVLAQAAETARQGAAERQIVIDTDIPPGRPAVVQADTWAVRRILDNLLANAVKFSRPGSHVLASVENSAGNVSIVVHDSGIGMPPEVLRHIGEPFYQSETSTGTGTGLALSRRLALAMNATLVFESEQGEGTTAALRLRG